MVVSGQQIDFTVINFCMSKNSLSASRWLAGSNHSLVEEKKNWNQEYAPASKVEHSADC